MKHSWFSNRELKTRCIKYIPWRQDSNFIKLNKKVLALFDYIFGKKLTSQKI